MLYNLKPYEINPEVQNIQVQASIKRNQNILVVEYTLIDPQDKIFVSPDMFTNKRQKGLWKSTCFEIFWKPSVSKNNAYWELNLSSDLNWNVFVFDDIRKPVEKEDLNVKDISFSRKNSKPHQFFIELDLGQCGLGDQKIKLSLTTVLEHKNKTKSYWALAHKGSAPDFHNMESFIITI